MQHIDTAQTNLCPHSYEESCSTAHSMLFFPAEISRIDSFPWVSLTMLTCMGTEVQEQHKAGERQDQAARRAMGCSHLQQCMY